MKLDLGSGPKPREGFQGIDLYAPNTEAIDLLDFPWPWPTESVDEIYCSHFVEHLPATEVNRAGRLEKTYTVKHHAGKDYFFAFFDECYRIMKYGAIMTVVVPALQSVRAFQDPTHRRFIPAESFVYLSHEWRKMNGLDYYNVECNFDVKIASITQGQENTSSEDLMAHWGKVLDWQATLVKQ